MNKNKFFKLFCLLAVVVVFCLMAACSQPKDLRQLSEPANLRVEEGVLVWDGVENACGYMVYYKNEEFPADQPRYDLSSFASPGVYLLQVQALGDGKNYSDSDCAEYSYEVKDSQDVPSPPEESEDDDHSQVLVPTRGLTYTPLSDGSGYSVSRGSADLPEVLVIPESYNGLPVKEIGDFTNKYQFSIISNTVTREVHLPETAESIVGDGFSMFKALREIYIPKSVKVLGSGVFEKSGLQKVTFAEDSELEVLSGFSQTSITQIDIPQGVKEIGGSAFYGTPLTRIDIPEGVTSIGGGAFKNCTELAHITWPRHVESWGVCLTGSLWLSLQPEGLVVFDGVAVAYNRADGDGELVIPSEVQVLLGGVFEDTGVVSVTLHNGLKFSMKDDYAPDELPSPFKDCASIESVVLPSDITVIPRQFFRNCTALKNVALPQTLTSISQWGFAGCTSLKSISLPSSLQLIEREAFKGSGLTYIDIPDGVEVQEQAFISCYDLASYTLGKDVVVGRAVFYSCTSLGKVMFPASLSVIPNYMFYNCTSLVSVEIPSHISTIDSSAFSNCTSLKQVILPDNIVVKGGAFKGCSSLGSITIPQGASFTGTNTFSECTSLEEVVFKGTEIIASLLFDEVTSLKTVVFDEGVVEIGESAFRKCGLVNIRFPSTLKVIGEGAFIGCTSLKEVIIPDGVQLGEECFYNCSSLQSVTLPGDILVIPKSCFNGCWSLASVSLPQSVEIIERRAFGDCISLTSFTIPESVLDIGKVVFAECDNLKQVVMPAHLAAFVENILMDVQFEYNNIEQIYCTGSEEQWRQALPAGYVLPAEVTVYYYAEDAQQAQGGSQNYWHYVEGEVTLWVKEHD